jgi:tetratricopeptide (TPR) repeat protein
MLRILCFLAVLIICNISFSQESRIEAELAMANRLLSEVKYDEALAHINAALDIDPLSLEALEKKANVMILSDQIKLYQKELSDKIDQNPTQPEYYYIRALLFAHRQKPQKTVEDFQYAIENNIPAEFMEKVFLNRGMAFYNIGDFPAAESDFENALQLNPQYSTAYHSWGMLKYELKEFDSAVEFFNKALQFEESNAVIYYNLAMSYLRLKDMENACKNFNISSSMGYKNAFKVYFLECTE